MAYTISSVTVSKVEGGIESLDALAKQKFPRLNISIDKVARGDVGEKLNVDYTFVAEYFDDSGREAKSIGKILLSGLVEVNESSEVISGALKKWTDSKTLPIELAEEVINTLNFRCSATGTLVAYSLGLIPPLMISTTKIAERKPTGSAT